MRRRKMFRKARGAVVSFCERCGQVCTSACRRDLLLARARERALTSGMRVL